MVFFRHREAENSPVTNPHRILTGFCFDFGFGGHQNLESRYLLVGFFKLPSFFMKGPLIDQTEKNRFNRKRLQSI